MVTVTIYAVEGTSKAKAVGSHDSGGDTSDTSLSSASVGAVTEVRQPQQQQQQKTRVVSATRVVSDARVLNKPLEKKTILSETVKGLRDVAGESYAALKEWATSPREGNASQEEERIAERMAARQALQDLMSPFMACHGGGSYVPRTEKNNDVQFSNLGDLRDSIYMLANNDSASIYTADSQAEDEMMQLQRLTSWGTNATGDTTATNTTSDTAEASHRGLTDDDGQVIPKELLASAQKRREKRRRKRVVRFDYPPISSLRECPRPDPNDLPDLFFTEEELDEIEADRSSAVAVDDIEIVAVASAQTEQSDSSPVPSPQHPSAISMDGTNSLSTPNKSPKFSRKPRASSPHPRRSAPKHAPSPKGQISPSPSTSSSDPRLIKGVQIYLRERSTGKGQRS